MLRRTAFFFIALALVFSSCDPCNNLDCISSDYFGQLRVTNKSDGRDLVFGAGSRYNSKDIRFYMIRQNDTVYFDYEPLYFPGNGYDSILYVHFYPATDQPVYIKLSDTDTDTLQLSYDSYKSRCCGIITNIQSVQYNNSTAILENQGIMELKK